jgi:hypothetical protein
MAYWRFQKMKTYLLALSGLAFAALFATSASAVPGSGIKAADNGSNVIQADYRHGCHWWNGHRHCLRDDNDHPSVVIDWGDRRNYHDHDDDHHDHDMHGDKGDRHDRDDH